VEDKEECSICMEIYKLNEIVFELPCVHIYHKECIKKWLKSNNTCPICRYELPMGIDNENVNNFSDPMTDLTDDDEYWNDTNEVIDVDNYNNQDNENSQRSYYYSDDSESSCHCSPHDNHSKEVIIIEDSDEQNM